MTEHDWYAYLRLPPEATAGDIERVVERLSRQASALAATASERSQLLRETVRAIKRDLLPGPGSPAAPRRTARAASRPARAGAARAGAARAGAARTRRPGRRRTPGPLPAYRLDLPCLRQGRRAQRQVLHPVRHPDPPHPPAGRAGTGSRAQAAPGLRELCQPTGPAGRLLFDVRRPALTTLRNSHPSRARIAPAIDWPTGTLTRYLCRGGQFERCDRVDQRRLE